MAKPPRRLDVLRHVRFHGNTTHLGDEASSVIVLVRIGGLLVGIEEVCRHLLGGIPLRSARPLGRLAIENKGMAVVHEHMAQIAGQRRLGLGFPAQQGIRIDAVALFLVAKLVAAKIPFRPLPAWL
jgi:hypothetical protein